MNRYIFLTGMAVMLTLMSCGPVNRFTRLKHIPREYSGNFGLDNVLATRSEMNKQPWIVRSDHPANPSYQIPGGKTTVKKHEFMAPFLVIGEKDRFLELIAYTPDLIKNRKLTNHKKAVYCGWMSKSQLLLTPTAVSDVFSEEKVKTLTAITDTLPLFHAGRYFEGDSVQLFADPELTQPIGKTGLYHLVYRMKKSIDGKKWLISAVPTLPEDGKGILGWIDNIMLQETARRLYIRIPETPENAPTTLIPAPAMAPVLHDSLVSFRTLIPHPVIDRNDNCIYNVDGEKITYAESRQLEQELRHLDIVFTFEPGETLLTSFPTFINAIQNTVTFFKDTDKFRYTFSAVVATQDGRLLSTTTKSPDELTEWLLANYSAATGIAPKTIKEKDWLALRAALNLMHPDARATRIIVNIGENMQGGEIADKALSKRLAALNCRLLCFQLSSGPGNQYHNYILQASSLIAGYADERTRLKRRITVFTDQLRQENRFSENTRNSYMLDFPARSTTQGLVVFPAKTEQLPAELLVNSIDTLLKQVKSDNLGVINAFGRAFQSAASKDKYDQSFTSNFNISPRRRIDSTYRKTFGNKDIWWLTRNDTIKAVYTDSTRNNFFLLLDADELESIRNFIAGLSAREVDTRDKAKDRQRKQKIETLRRKLLRQGLKMPQEEKNTVSASQSPQPPEYASTRKLRSHLCQLYRNLGNTGISPLSRRELKKMQLSQLHARITLFPSTASILTDIRAGDLRNKKKCPDELLDRLIHYFKTSKDLFEGGINPQNEVTSGNNKYYRIPMNLLP